MTDPDRTALRGALVEQRAQTRPRDHMARAGEPDIVHADLGDEHPRDAVTDPGYRRQAVGGLAKGPGSTGIRVLDLGRCTPATTLESVAARLARSGPGDRTMYCAIDLLFDRVRGRGSTVAAGPISDTPAGANRWDGGERETGRTVRQRVLVPVDTPALRAALKAPAEEVSKRCRSMLKQLKTQSGPRPADIVALAAATWPENMAVLMEMMSTIAAVRHGRRVHPPNRQRWWVFRRKLNADFGGS